MIIIGIAYFSYVLNWFLNTSFFDIIVPVISTIKSMIYE